MRIALTVWDGRIAPVFDVARALKLVDTDGETVVNERLVALPSEGGMMPRVAALVDLGVSILVCGAVSRPVHLMLTDSGIKVYAFVSGDYGDVLGALLSGNFDENAFSMPGCGMRGRRAHRRRAAKNPRGGNGGFCRGRKER